MRCYQRCCEEKEPVGVYQPNLGYQGFDSYYMCERCWKKYLPSIIESGYPHFSLKRREVKARCL